MTRRAHLQCAVVLLIVAGCSTPRATNEPSARTASAAVAHESPRPSRTLPSSSGQPGVAVGVHGAVATAEANASKVGLAVLEAGGNAVDAAIAIAFALAVTHPLAGNLGGGGFMVVRTARGESVAIDYREVAPLAATRDMYLDAAGNLTHDSVNGARAAGIAGTVAGLALAHERFGKKPWAQLLAPAIALARNGHVVDAYHADELKKAVERMRKAGFDGSTHYYVADDGSYIAEGATWKQPELASTLEQLATQGAHAFYAGELAQRIVAGVKALGGVWTAEDLASYHALAREPLRFSYLGREVVTMPPPSAGGIVLRQLLFASEEWHMREQPWRSPEAAHLFVEAARRAYADRNAWIADPDFASVPVATLTSSAYLHERMSTIDPAHATPSSAIKAGAANGAVESHETTHFSVVDDAGNAVANTYTLNASFGALVVAPGTGILLNDEMDDFASQPGKPNQFGLVQGERNEIEPKKRMLSSMTPTIIVENGQLRAVLGSPGGATITTTVAQLVRALIDYGEPLDAAVRAPRVHHQWLPDQVSTETELEPAIADGLRALGHTVNLATSGRIGHANCIEVDPATHGYRAVADVTRGDGSALAY